MTHIPSHDPWNASAETERAYSLAELTTAPTRKRRIGLFVALAAAAVVLAAGTGLIFAFSRHDAGQHPASSQSSAADDASGRLACGIAKHIQIGQVDRVGVNAIHSQTVTSTHPDLVYRGNALYDSFNTLAVQVVSGELTDAEVQLRLGTPLIEFQTACVQAGYGG